MARYLATLGDKVGGEVADQEPVEPRLDEGQNRPRALAI